MPNLVILSYKRKNVGIFVDRCTCKDVKEKGDSGTDVSKYRNNFVFRIRQSKEIFLVLLDYGEVRTIIVRNTGIYK